MQTANRKPPANSQSPIAISQRGFTLVEMLIALAVFGVIVGIASGYLISTISVQRDTLAIRPMVDEVSFVAEYMSRALRPAQKAQNDACLSTADLYYESVSSDTVRFIDREERCREISYDSAQQKIVEQISSDATSANFESVQAITSPTIFVQSLIFEVISSGTQHPRVTFSLQVLPRDESDAQPLELQTTISQREF